MSGAPFCPECGQRLEGDLPRGICPRCLMRIALRGPSIETADANGAGPSGGSAPPHDPMPSWAEGLRGWDLRAGIGTGSDSATVDESTPGTSPSDTYATRPASDPDAAAPSPPIGDWPAPPGYEILEAIGRGGMGVVYKARQSGLNRLVALKMIRDEDGAGPEQRERFRIEAEAVARLRHPNVVQIHEVGQAVGRPYFSLELLEGGSLAERIAAAPQPTRASAALLAALAGAVQAAHEAGVVHRDLKPQNVLFDRDGTPKVTDFGLAKRLDSGDGPTLSFQVMGTPAYMAPEQALGKNREVGPLADVYALGAILYAMLTGRPPLQGTSWRETLLMVAEREPVPPSKIQPRIPRDLETICLKCLAKEPARRYGSAAALAEDLGRFLEGRPIAARRTPAWERATKWARRHPTTSALAASVLAAAIGLVAWAIRADEAARLEAAREDGRVAAVREEAEAELLKARGELARDEPAAAQATLERLLGSIHDEARLVDARRAASAALDEAQVRLGRKARVESDRDRFARFVKLADEALLQDTMAAGLGRGGRPDLTRAPARAALALYGGEGASPPDSTLPEADRAQVASDLYMLHLVLATAVARAGPGEDPTRQAREALAVLDRAARLRGPTRAYHARRADCLERAGDPAGAALEREQAGQLEPSGAFDHLLIGQERLDAGDLAAALRHFDLALRDRPDLFWARCLSAIALLNSRPSRPAEARVALTACLLQRPSYAWLLMLRGTACGQMGATALDLAARLPDRAEGLRAEAESHFRAAEDDFRRAEAMGLDAEFRPAWHMDRGVARYQAGRHEDAAADFERAASLDPSRHDALASLAQALERLGRHAEALGRLDEAVRLRPDVAPPRRDRALLRIGADDPSKDDLELALADLDEAIRRDPPASRDLADDHARRSGLLLRLGRPADALASADAALAIAPGLADAHRDRVAALLGLRRYGEAIGSCDAALEKGPPSAELHELRGLARVGRGEFATAIADYTRALALHPSRPRVLGYRGQAYLMANAPELALADFEELLKLDPADADGYAGRGAARARLRRHKEAVVDAEEALRRGGSGPARAYAAARTYAQALVVANAEVARRGRAALLESQRYERRAVELLTKAVEQTSADRREAFWREIVEADAAMAAIRRKARPDRPATR